MNSTDTQEPNWDFRLNNRGDAEGGQEMNLVMVVAVILVICFAIPICWSVCMGSPAPAAVDPDVIVIRQIRDEEEPDEEEKAKLAQIETHMEMHGVTLSRRHFDTSQNPPTLRVTRSNGHTVANTCAICITCYEIGEKLVWSPSCTHAFHDECIDTWLRNKHSDLQCPVCRQNFVVMPEGEENPVDDDVEKVLAAAVANAIQYEL